MPVTTLIAGKHDCVGNFSLGPEALPSENPSALDKMAMLVYCGKFMSMDGEVEITEPMIDKLLTSHNTKLEKFQSAGQKDTEYFSKMPPVQLDHSTSARDTVGRAVGVLTKGTFSNEDGIPVPCLMCSRLTILGKTNVEHVVDGRWANLSIGADLEAGTLNEISITPFPAAPHSAMLARRRLNDWKTYSKGNYRGFPYQIETDDNKFFGYIDNVDFHDTDPVALLEQMKKYIDSKPKKAKLGEGDSMETKEQLKARHMSEKEALAASHAEELKTHKLEEVKSKHEEQMMTMKKKHMEELKKYGFSDDVTEEDKKLSDGDAGDPTKKEGDALSGDKPPKPTDVGDEEELTKKLSAARPNIIKLAKTIKAGMSASRLMARKEMVNSKISRLRASAKLTPAEQKKINLTELAAKSDSELEAFFKGYELREDVIDPRFHGTTKALSVANFQRMAKKQQMSILEHEARLAGVGGAPITDDQRKELENAYQLPHSAPHEAADHEDGMMKHLVGLLGEHQAKDAILMHVKKMMDACHMKESSAMPSEESEKQMSALVKDINRLQTEIQDLITMVSDATGIAKTELE